MENLGIKIKGVQVDDTGDRLAIWTDDRHVYIFDRQHYKENEKDLEELLGTWDINSVITPIQGESVKIVSIFLHFLKTSKKTFHLKLLIYTDIYIYICMYKLI